MNNRIDLCDLHAHVLPKADHGSSSVEVSVRQLSLAKKCGVSRIVATPHFYPHKTSVFDFLQKRDASYEELRPFIPEGIELKLGAEVLLCDNIENLPNLDKLCISGSKTLLLELPFSNLESSYMYSVAGIIDRGINVVLAHAERYDPSFIDELVSVGASIQLNAYVLCKRINRDSYFYRWLTEGSVVAIGSDIHDTDKYAYAYFKKAIRKGGKFISQISGRSDALWHSFCEEKHTSDVIMK